MGWSEDLRSSFNGATLRKILGLPDVMSDVRPATFKGNSGDVQVAQNFSDVWVTYTETLTGHTGVGRLHAPGTALWRFPRTGDSMMVLKPSMVDGPGVPYVMYGDGGGAKRVPAWLDFSNSGTSVPENWRVEAGGSITIKSSSGAATGGQDGATTATMRFNQDGSVSISGGQGVNVSINANGGGVLNLCGSSHPLPLWDTFLADFAAFIDAVANATVIVTVPGGVPTGAFLSAALVLQTKMLALHYNSTVVNNG